MIQTLSASLRAEPTATFYSITGSPSSDSVYPDQAFFKEKPLQWWVDSINNGSVKYTPRSNLYWSYVNDSGNQHYISNEITNLLIPRYPDTNSFTNDLATKVSKIRFIDNNYMTMTCTYTF